MNASVIKTGKIKTSTLESPGIQTKMIIPTNEDGIIFVRQYYNTLQITLLNTYLYAI